MLAGYFLLKQSHGYRHRTLRESGQHLVFGSALAASILVFFTQLIVHFVSKYIPKLVPYSNGAFGSDYTATAVLSLLLALLVCPVNNSL